MFRGIRYCVLRLSRFGVAFCRVVLCGVRARPVAFRCGTLPCGVLHCVVLLVLFLVGLVGLSFGGVVVSLFLWSFALLSVVVWHIVGVLCWYVSCAPLLCCVAPCYMFWCCASMRWLVQWCASGIVTRCCVLLLGSLLFCVACCVVLWRTIVWLFVVGQLLSG